VHEVERTALDTPGEPQTDAVGDQEQIRARPSRSGASLAPRQMSSVINDGTLAHQIKTLPIAQMPEIMPFLPSK
jgi:hypothetical protein